MVLHLLHSSSKGVVRGSIGSDSTPFKMTKKTVYPQPCGVSTTNNI